MTKAILVIDMPESCNTCPIFQQGKGYDRYDLCPVHKSKTIIGGDHRYGGCPLKEPPKIKYTKETIYADKKPYISLYTLTDYDKGFDDCLIELGIVKRSEVEEYEEGEDK